MKNRIFNHYLTTILGVAILTTTLILVWKNKTTITEAGILITLSSALILSKDTLLRDVNDQNEQK